MPSKEDIDQARSAVERGMELMSTVYGSSHLEYYKGLIYLAINYTTISAYREAFQLLSEIPKSYYDGIIEKQLKEDQLFMSVAVKVADAMAESGLIQPPVFYGHKFLVQPVAQA
jgi:hypothetical protein